MTQLDDSAMRAAYARRRVAARGPVPIETLEALANGTYVGADREDVLNRVLSDPGTAREFHFLHDVAASARQASTRAWWKGVPGLALAAGGALVITLGTQLFTAGGDDEGPMRSTGDSVALWQPAEGATAATSTPVTFAWSPVANARDYELTIVGADGAEQLRQAVSDTLVTVALPAGSSAWWITARILDGATRQSPVRPLSAR